MGIGPSSLPRETDLGTQQYCEIGLGQLESTSALRSQGMITFCDYLKDNAPSFEYIRELLPKMGLLHDLKENFFIPCLDPKRDNTKLIHIPLILTHWFFTEHIVILTINFTKSTIEYYDSQGTDIKKETRTIQQLNISPKDFANAIAMHVFKKEVEIKSNPSRHQGFFDRINCGLFACNYMDRRQTECFEDVCNNPTYDINAERRQMAKNIRNHYPFLDKG